MEGAMKGKDIVKSPPQSTSDRSLEILMLRLMIVG